MHNPLLNLNRDYTEGKRDLLTGLRSEIQFWLTKPRHSQDLLSKRSGVSPQMLSDILSNRRGCSPETSEKITDQRVFQALSAKYKNAGQRIALHQSGWVEEFGDINQPSRDTIRKKNDDDFDDTCSGTVPRDGGSSDPAWKGDLATAIVHIGRAIENVGVNRSVDDGTLEGLNLLASTAQKLVELPNDVSIRKATVNQSGVTAPVQSYPYNAASSKAGPTKAVMSSDLSKRVEQAENFLFQARMHEAHIAASTRNTNNLFSSVSPHPASVRKRTCRTIGSTSNETA